MSYDGGPMTEAMYYVLLALYKPNYGYQLMQAIGDVSNGRIQMGPGTLYGILTRLQNAMRRRKTYELTTYGEIALRNEYDRLQEMIHDGRGLTEKSAFYTQFN